MGGTKPTILSRSAARLVARCRTVTKTDFDPDHSTRSVMIIHAVLSSDCHLGRSLAEIFLKMHKPVSQIVILCKHLNPHGDPTA